MKLLLIVWLIIFFLIFIKNDIARKPQREITIDDLCRITRADGAATFEISTSKKTFYLTADSIAAMEDWVKVLQVIYILISLTNYSIIISLPTH